MSNKMIELRQQHAALLDEVRTLTTQAESEDRDFTPDELTAFNEKMAKAEEYRNRISRLEAADTAFKFTQEKNGVQTRQAPAFNKIPLGDNETRAWAHFIKTGNDGHLKELRASNDTDMNVGTAADGGNAVPTGHYQGIVARRNESMLAQTLGVRMIPGIGTTVNVPVDNEADGEFVSTNEASAYDRDAPALDKAAMTLVKYTKKIEISVELLNDEDSRLLTFLEDFVGRGMAKTHNNLLLTEVAANGTSLKTYASATAIAAGEPEDIAFNDNLAYYLDDTMSVGWVMRPTTFGDIASLTGNNRLYAQTVGGSFSKELLGFPVHYSNQAAATAASAKDVYFGNWNYVGLREDPGFSVIRDQFTLAHLGQIRLIYMFRAVYKTLVAPAIGYAVHPSA